MAKSKSKKNRPGSHSFESRLQALPPVTRAQIERAVQEFAAGSAAPHLTAKARAELRRALTSGLGDLRFQQLLLYAQSLPVGSLEVPEVAEAVIAELSSDTESSSPGDASSDGDSTLPSASDGRPMPAVSSLPPRTAEFVLFLALDAADRETLLGDLAEDYATNVLPRFGRLRAAFWYWCQVFRSIGPLGFKRLKAWGKWAVVADLVHRTISRL